MCSDTCTYIVQFIVEAARVADGFTGVVAPPQCGGRCLAVGADHALPSLLSLSRGAHGVPVTGTVLLATQRSTC